MKWITYMLILFLAAGCSSQDGPEDSTRDQQAGDRDAGNEDLGDADGLADHEDADDVDEALEYDLLVTTEADDGPGSLRAILTEAPSGGRIGFADHVARIIVERPLVVERDVVIEGRGVEELQISGGKFGRIFEIEAQARATITDLQLIDGRAEQGGAIFNEGALRLADCELWENGANQEGGALFNAGDAHLERVYFVQNWARRGGSIFNAATLEMNLVHLDESIAGEAGAALFNEGESTILASLLTQNTAANGEPPRFDDREAGARGGAIYNAGELWMTNTTIFRNYGQFGGGLFNDGRAWLAHTTIVGTLGAHGGGLVHGAGAETTLGATIIDWSQADVHKDLDIFVVGDAEGFQSLGHNVVGVLEENPGFEKSGEGDLFGSPDQPLFSGVQALDDHGGVLKTLRLDPRGKAFANVPGDRCLDAAGEPLRQDARGQRRPVIRSCDSGAFQTAFMKETFDDLAETGEAPADGSFEGRGFIRWDYEAATSEQDYPLDYRGLILVEKGSRIFSEKIPGGVTQLVVEMRKAFASSQPRQLEIRVNDKVVATSEQFGGQFGVDDKNFLVALEGLDIDGDVVIEIRNISGGEITIDNIRWSSASGL